MDLQPRIRLAEKADAPAIAAMVDELMFHEGKEGVCEAAFIERWAFGPDPAFHVLLAESAERAPLGYLAFYRAFTLFKGGPVLLVENLFVRKSARGYRLGRHLMAAAAAEALRRGCLRLELNVRTNNPQTIAFYERVGLFAPGEAVYRIDGPSLKSLAEEKRP